MNERSPSVHVAIVNAEGKIIGVVRNLVQSQVTHEMDGTLIYKYANTDTKRENPCEFWSYNSEELERMWNAAVSSVFIGSRYYIIR